MSIYIGKDEADLGKPAYYPAKSTVQCSLRKPCTSKKLPSARRKNAISLEKECAATVWLQLNYSYVKSANLFLILFCFFRGKETGNALGKEKRKENKNYGDAD